jgi:hypothetical protein
MKFPAGVHRLTKMPKGNDIKGKVWWDADVHLPDGTAVVGRYEKNRGAFVYFAVDGLTYRAFTERFIDKEACRDGCGVFHLKLS